GGSALHGVAVQSARVTALLRYKHADGEWHTEDDILGRRGREAVVPDYGVVADGLPRRDDLHGAIAVVTCSCHVCGEIRRDRNARVMQSHRQRNTEPSTSPVTVSRMYAVSLTV